MNEYKPSEHQLNDVEKDRDLYIGGSDLPSILKYNTKKYGKSVIEFAKQKLNLIPSTFKGNEHTRYGQYMEPLVRDYISNMLGHHFVEDTIIDKKRGYRANCDGIDKEHNVLLEIKTFSGSLDVKYYTPQCQFYMELFNIEVCYLVGYKKPDDFYIGLDYSVDNTIDYFNLEFDESRVVIYKLCRDREMFKQIEIEIDKFKYLLDCLREEEILNGKCYRKCRFEV